MIHLLLKALLRGGTHKHISKAAQVQPQFWTRRGSGIAHHTSKFFIKESAKGIKFPK